MLLQVWIFRKRVNLKSLLTFSSLAPLGAIMASLKDKLKSWNAGNESEAKALADRQSDLLLGSVEVLWCCR